MDKIAAEVKSGRVLIADGAWGTLLQKRGFRQGTCPELWCVEQRDAVLDIARQYVAAGADMIESNSFGGTRFKLEHFGLEGRVAELNEAAAAISREAAGPGRHVIASVGPTGKLLLMEEVTAEEVYDAFKAQMIALERGGADACCIETFAALDEAILAIKAARENTRLEVLCTFTFQKTVHNDYHTMMGVTPAEMAVELIKAGADVIGANCGNGMTQMKDIVREIRKATPAIPILIQANAGMPVNVDGVDVFPEPPAEMAALAVEVVAAGANIVGGCCGTTPEHIRAIAAAVRR
jgi:5-methyltetrahydrofolate--homocysteine methyltransferase